MEKREKQWRKNVFKDSRKLIFADKLGFFWKILIFVIAMMSVGIIGEFIQVKVNGLIGLIIGVLMWIFINTMFSKFLILSNEHGMSAAIDHSHVSFKIYVNCLISNVISTVLKSGPAIILATILIEIGIAIVKGMGININMVMNLFAIQLGILLVISFVFKVLFFSVGYILIEGKESNFLSAIKRAVEMTLQNFVSTVVVLITVTVQVYVIAIAALWGLIQSGFGILTILAFIFVIVALMGYYELVQIKWYKCINAKYEKEKINKKK